jgi:hypothetical protein
MITNISRYKADLEKVVKLGETMKGDLAFRHLKAEGKMTEEEQKVAKSLEGKFEEEYQRWYTESAAVIRQLLPDRLQEFESLYKGDGKRKDLNATNYHIQDWLNGIRAGTDIYKKKYYDDFAIVVMRFSTQLDILRAVGGRFESSLFDIQQLVQADLFDSELDAAKALAKHGFSRAAGAMAGVVLERHLAQVATNHKATVRKQHPTINDFNEQLKSANVLDVPTWRFIQRLGDIRNLCDHNKSRDPTMDEITELVDGVGKITKTVF